MAFTVGQLAKLTGLTVRALHHYDAIGLLVPSQRSDSGYRLYVQSDIIKLFRIQALQGLGLSLGEIDAVLQRDGAALPELLTRQVSALDSQIEQATELRTRLLQLLQTLARGAEPATGEWLDAVELTTVYDRHCSPEELKRLIAHHNDPASWRALFDEVRSAMNEGIAPQSARAEALIGRWSDLMLRSVGGDLKLAIKMKLAYAQDAGMQARMAMQSGMDHEVMAYLGQAATHKHLTLWSNHLSRDEVLRLRPDGSWSQSLLQVVGALRQEMSLNATPKSEGVRSAVRAWDALVEAFVDADSALANKVEQALARDGDLQHCWILDPALLQFVQRARSVV